MTEPLLPQTNSTESVIIAPTSTVETTAIKGEGNRLSSYFQIIINDDSELIFDERKGQILGNTYIKFSRNQHSRGRVIIEDPEDTLRETIHQGDAIAVNVGFTLEKVETVLRGTIDSIGRKLPTGTLIEFRDLGSQINQLTTGVINNRNGRETENTQSDSAREIQKYSSLNREIVPDYQQTLTTLTDDRIQFEDRSNSIVSKQGEIIWREGTLNQATREAALMGERIAIEGDTISRIAPDNAPSTGITIDYRRDRSAILGRPQILKKQPNRLGSSGGSWTVRGWDINSKSLIGATIVVPTPNNYNPDKTIVAAGQTLRMGDAITPGNLYSWGDALKGGARIPTSTAILDNIIKIAVIIDRLNRQYDSRKWTVTSWYRDPKANANAGGARRSRHLVGDAVDLSFAIMERVFAALEPNYGGGLAISAGSFIHLDARPARARWSY